MKNIGNPSMSLPFTWQYTSTQYKCIQSYQDYKQPNGMGCKLSYISGSCSIDTSIKPPVTTKYTTIYSNWGTNCASWINKERRNLANDCWKKSLQILNLGEQLDNKRTNNQYRCVITYKSGCTPQKSKCELVYGNGDSSNRNIIISADKDNELLSLFTMSSTITALKSVYPFSNYINKFNVYRMTDSPTFFLQGGGLATSFESVNKVFSACGLSYGYYDVIIPSKPYSCKNFAACYFFAEGVSFIDIDAYAFPGTYAHELMHSGGAIGESYGENPQMWTDASVNNVINWILKR
jgi:hypothetical protein